MIEFKSREINQRQRREKREERSGVRGEKPVVRREREEKEWA